MTKIESSGDSSRPWESYHTVYTTAKAGMEGVDKEKVQRVVYEMSKGSKYFENEERKDAYIKQKIEDMRVQSSKLTASDLSHYQRVADKRIEEMEASRDLSRIWLHVDMDAFYAAVETLSDPSLKGKPMAVGSMSMLSTANYEARRFGVRAAMPGFIACKLCPDLIFVPTDFKKYTYYSDLTRKVFQRYDPNFMATSLDEAFLDITSVCKERNLNCEEIAEELRKCIHDETGLTCSAGVAPNRLLAKVCSDINKPNGQFVLRNDRIAVITFISSLPIRKIGGIGKVTEHLLRDVFGITTCAEMLKKSAFLCALFSHSSADFFLSVGLGLGGTDTPQARLRKSISNERTFSATHDETLLYQKLVDLAEMLSADMKKEGLYGRTLTLKLKTASFEVRTRAVTLQKYICSNEEILKHASKLLKAELPVSLRLIGLRVSQLNLGKDIIPSDPTQKTLSSFILSAETCQNEIDRNMSMGSDISDQRFIDHEETCVPIDNHEICDKDLESDEFLPTNESKDEIFTKPTERFLVNDSQIRDIVKQESKVDFTKVMGDDFFSRSRKMEKGDNTSINSIFVWVDDYKCSLCGVELPPSFVEERQEHSDFHLAEKLQEEESTNHVEIHPLKERFTQKEERITSQSRNKKQKSSPAGGKHLPIDMFFPRSNKNL
ncbi:DNA polymerase kappa [Impatiens glandulifera]|uniref:DNA polymerase kappa n=1 Tax=Impatiens glandulifera TaxID=253017 RepID=UPI001FB18015|nr:DNA polymerase kappa [Impatiens glandulifera]